MLLGYDIAALKGKGFTQTAIAKRAGVSPSTISLELKCNSDKGLQFRIIPCSWHSKDSLTASKG